MLCTMRARKFNEIYGSNFFCERAIKEFLRPLYFFFKERNGICEKQARGNRLRWRYKDVRSVMHVLDSFITTEEPM